MSKINPKTPFLLTLYGYPGSGKTFLSRQLTEVISAVHLDSDRIRFELFSNPKYDKNEDKILSQVMNYMTEKFLTAGVSVVYDVNAARSFDRHKLKAMAKKFSALNLVVWLQIDADTAFVRNKKRDKRKSDDKYSLILSTSMFKNMISFMQNPTPNEDYVVVSGKHAFLTQKNAIFNKMRQLNIIDTISANEHLAMPGMVNLVPNGNMNLHHRNVIIR